MKNILIVVFSLKLGSGGAEKVAAQIGSEFYKSGYNTKYFTFCDSQKKYNYLGKEFCLNESYNGNIISKIFKFFRRSYIIKEYCKKEKIDTIFSFMEDSNAQVIISKFFGNKAKINISIRHSISDYGRGIYYRLIKLLYKYAENIVVLTHFEKNNLIKNFKIKKQKIKIIPNSIDIDEIKHLKNQDLGEYEKIFDSKKFTFITVGRLHKVKNQELIIKCFNKLNNKYPNIQLLILGDGELKNELEKISNKNVYFLGIQGNPYKFLSKCNCFLLSSLNEAFPNTMLEAMACGLPIISTEAQGPNEILNNGEYGILVKNNSEDDFYNAMEKILDDNIRDVYISKSAKRIHDYLLKDNIKSWKSII